MCRLHADQDEVVRRFTGRQRGGGEAGDLVRQVREDCDRMDVSGFAGVCVDTTGVSAAEAARLVRDRCRGWPGFGLVGEQPGAAPAAPDRPAASEANGSGGHVLLLCGPAGVGKSTIGFQLYLRCLRAGLTAAYIDLDQIGFLTPRPDGDPRNHRLKASNLAGIWRTCHAAGARHLVMSGPIENQAVLRSYVTALPAAAITTCRLRRARRARRRIMTRGEGGSWPQPGDPLRGQPRLPVPGRRAGSRRGPGPRSHPPRRPAHRHRRPRRSRSRRPGSRHGRMARTARVVPPGAAGQPGWPRTSPAQGRRPARHAVSSPYDPASDAG